jgi:hypothetical protein
VRPYPSGQYSAPGAVSGQSASSFPPGPTAQPYPPGPYPVLEAAPYPPGPTAQPYPPGPTAQPYPSGPIPAPGAAAGQPASGAYPFGQGGPGSVPYQGGGAGGRRRGVRVLGALVIVLALAVAGVGGRVLMVSNSAKNEISALKADADGRAKAKTAADGKLRVAFDQAALPDKLKKVKDLTTAAGKALTDWGTAGGKVERIKDVRDARNRCDEAILDYNAAAAPFPAELLADLPKTIDLTDSETNCGR